MWKEKERKKEVLVVPEKVRSRISLCACVVKFRTFERSNVWTGQAELCFPSYNNVMLSVIIKGQIKARTTEDGESTKKRSVGGKHSVQLVQTYK